MNLHLSLFSVALISLLCLHHHHHSALASSHFEGFDAEDDEDSTELHHSLTPPLLTQSESTVLDPEPDSTPITKPDPPPTQTGSNKPSPTSFDFWDEDEFEGLPEDEPTEIPAPIASESPSDPQIPDPEDTDTPKKKKLSSYTVEIVCVSILIAYLTNYFLGKRDNESLALSWASKFGLRDAIFEKNFSLLGVGEGDDSPLLLKEATNVFKFYASGRRYCHGMLATLELKSRHDLISRLFNCVVPCKDEISFEVYMNDEGMDHVVFALARKKAAKGMFKEMRDLQRFGGMVAAPGGRKWVAEELAVVSESKEVAGDMITDVVLDQVFGDKSFEKFGKYFISMHFSDQHPGKHRKMLLFKFALPDAKHMDDMVRLIALIPYYIDLIGRYKLSSQARNKTDGARQKVAQEAYKELESVRQEALQRKKAEKKRLLEEAEAKLSGEALRKKEAKERARQIKKSMPKVKMSRGH
ncbi:hypothetical protein HID58_078124 [Brassica napus]|uniref:BnaCnng62200D protein n=2 Tax=Brassica napus TaxID=3708 RepID=A0A078JRW3_BRANA|nr:uncharacterized protein At5g49945 [Brassica napus]KAH0871102.1 hypothetical protein HID58_078124 [Brassica napus]CAF2027741.1 unnamed protein product [Brassica napus]CDY69165.1 BnaCnng62200D [Brassica napus]